MPNHAPLPPTVHTVTRSQPVFVPRPANISLFTDAKFCYNVRRWPSSGCAVQAFVPWAGRPFSLKMKPQAYPLLTQKSRSLWSGFLYTYLRWPNLFRPDRPKSHHSIQTGTTKLSKRPTTYNRIVPERIGMSVDSSFSLLWIHSAKAINS